jgi:hypothetical protein
LINWQKKDLNIYSQDLNWPALASPQKEQLSKLSRRYTGSLRMNKNMERISSEMLSKELWHY